MTVNSLRPKTVRNGSEPVDPDRWPDVAAVPSTPAARLRGAAAQRLFRRAVSGLPIVVDYPDSAPRTEPTGAQDRPRMTIDDPTAFARRIGTSGLIGFGESYMAGEWSADDLVGVLEPFASRVGELVPPALQRLRTVVLPGHPGDEDNSVGNTRSNISRHYDLSNELFASFLDETMTYSSGLFDSVDDASFDDLAAAQRTKIDRLLDAAGVGPGTRLLEIGTGWGELCLRAAARGATVRSVTLSHEQRELALRRVRAAGLDRLVEIDLVDYRQVSGRYDAVVSVEMIEAVGQRYWGDYFQVLDDVLVPGGRAAIQAITMPHDRMLASARTYTWVHKYIFPGGQLPSVRALRESAAATTAGLSLVDELSMGPHYARTLALWRERFAAGRADVEALGFDRTFRRMWDFYLAYSEAGFASGYLDVQQLCFAKRGTT
ncbi:MAG: cyclopropane-fatty-acyl-phospholipid synthase family protein [Gordonia sp. (in: high G+C Gram-positive bacteria)]